MAKRQRRRGPNRPIDERIAELEAEVVRLKTQVDQSRKFSADELAQHRERLELSAADYAELVGVSPLTIYNWEKGRTRPRPAELERWFGVSKLKMREAWSALGYEA